MTVDPSRMAGRTGRYRSRGHTRADVTRGVAGACRNECILEVMRNGGPVVTFYDDAPRRFFNATAGVDIANQMHYCLGETRGLVRNDEVASWCDRQSFRPD